MTILQNGGIKFSFEYGIIVVPERYSNELWTPMEFELILSVIYHRSAPVGYGRLQSAAVRRCPLLPAIVAYSLQYAVLSSLLGSGPEGDDVL